MTRCQRLRNFCFTLNNYTDEEIEKIQNADIFKYIIFGRETGEEGTPHLQGYAELEKQTSFDVLKGMFPRLHIERRRGAAHQAANYCRKEDATPFERGTISRPGRRTDLDLVCQSISEGQSLAQVAAAYPSTYVRNYRGIQHYQQLLEEKRNWVPQVILLHGPAGTGKTRTAVDAGATLLSTTDKWTFISGYNGEDIVCFDDVCWDDIPRQIFLRLCDRYPVDINVKGGHRNWKPKIIYFTSNYDPQEFLLDDAIARRVTETIHLITPAAEAEPA